MTDPNEIAVRRAIVAMHENLGGSVTIDDLARAAMFSKFHFARVFQRTTGISPARFLSALRLQRAKHLLTTTSLRVADISSSVGYNSTGTFSTRFTRSVGLSPIAYRQTGGFVENILSGPEPGRPSAYDGAVRGLVSSVDSRPHLIYLGLFPDRIPEGRPVRCLTLRQPGPFWLERVPMGVWFLLAQAVPVTTLSEAADHTFTYDHGLTVGSTGPIAIGPNGSVAVVELRLRPARLLDPPVLLALTDARRGALAAFTGGVTSLAGGITSLAGGVA